MRFLPLIARSALRNVRRFVLTGLAAAASPFAVFPPMTVLRGLERDNPQRGRQPTRPPRGMAIGPHGMRRKSLG